MATVVKCDKCGTFQGVIEKAVVLKSFNGATITTHDLCTDCRGDLHLWLMSPKPADAGKE